MAEKVILKVVAETSKASKDMNKLSSDTKGAAAETTLLGGAMNMVRGAMAKVRVMSKLLFGSVKAGLISTGIGAFVVIIASLFAYFKNTKRGAEMLERAMAGVGAVVNVITDLFSSFGEIVVGAFENPQQAIKDLWEAIKTNMLNRMTGIIDSWKALGKVIKSAIDLDWDGVKEGAAEYGESVTQIATGVDDLTGKMAAGFKALGDEIEKDVTAAMKLKGLTQQLKDEEREFAKVRAQTRQDIQKARLDALDETKTVEERLAAVQRANELEKKTTQDVIEMQKRKIRIQKETMALSENMAEDLDELAALEVGLIDLQTSSFQTQKRLATEMETLTNEIAANKKTKEKERIASEKLDLQAFTDFNLQRIKDETDEELKIRMEGAKEQQVEAKKLLTMQQENALLLIEDANERALAKIEIDRQNALDSVADTEHTEATKAAINEKYNLKKQAQNKATSDAERKLGVGDLGAAASLLGGMADMQQEGTEKWKSMKSAEARINSFVSAQAAFSSMAGIPIVGTAMGIIAAGLAIAQGQKQIDAINATEIPKMARGGVVGGHGSGTSDSVNAKLSKGEVVINAKSAKMFRGALSGMNVAGGGVAFARGGATSVSEGAGFNGFSNEPLKAYVLTDEMTSSQDRLSKIRRRSSI